MAQKPTIEQFQELFKKIDKSVVTRDSFQEFLDRSVVLGLERIMREALNSAKEIASQITISYRRSEALAAIAAAYAQVQDFERAREIASQITDKYPRSTAFAAIAAQSYNPQDFDRAKEIASHITIDSLRSEALAAIAAAYAQVQDFERAREIASQIIDGYERSKAFADIAKHISYHLLARAAAKAGKAKG